MSVQKDTNLWEFLQSRNLDSSENLKELSSVLLRSKIDPVTDKDVLVNDPFLLWKKNVVRCFLVDQTQTQSLINDDESTLCRGQRPTAECFLSSALLKLLLQTSERISTKRTRACTATQHCRGERIENINSIPLPAPYGDFGSRKAPNFSQFEEIEDWMNAYGWEYEMWLDETEEEADDGEDEYYNACNQEEREYDEYITAL